MGLARKVAVFAAVLLPAQPAMALPPGVFVSPGSPAGKEYSFPLSVLRGDGTGHVTPAGAPAPLFGVGIHPAAPASTAPPAGRTTRRSAPARHHRHTVRVSRPVTRTPTPPPAQTRPAGLGREPALASLVRPGSDLPQVTLITAVVLLVGVAFGAGIAVARRRG